MTATERQAPAWKVRLREQVRQAAIDRHGEDGNRFIRMVAINDAYPLIEAAVWAQVAVEVLPIIDRIIAERVGADDRLRHVRRVLAAALGDGEQG